MSIKITGTKPHVVKSLQRHLDDFSHWLNVCKELQTDLNTLCTQSCQLAEVPDRENRIQTILFKFKNAARQLQDSARRAQERTDARHIEIYFRSRGGHWHSPRVYHSYIDSDHGPALKKVNQTATEVLQTNYTSAISNMEIESNQRKEEAQAAIEFSLIDQTFPNSSNELITENPAEYLRQAALYQHKLLQKEDAVTILDFGKSWAKNLPKEASWEHIESMSLGVIDAARQLDNVDLTEYCTAIEGWLKEHPLPENPDPILLSPAQATSLLGRRTYVIGLLYIYKSRLDLSPHAFHLYQACSSLYPDQNFWKVAQAYYYISGAQWVEAEQLLTGLSTDDPSVKHAQQYLSDTLRERQCSAVLDLGALALYKLIPSSWRDNLGADVTLTAIQLVTNRSSRKVWLPHLIKTSEGPISIRHLAWSLDGMTMTMDVVDLVFRHAISSKRLQKAKSLTSLICRVGSTAWTVRSDYQQLISFQPLSILHLTSSLISLDQAYDECQEIHQTPARQALFSTATKLLSDISCVFTATHYADLLPTIGIQPQYLANQISAAPLMGKITSFVSTDNPKASRNRNLLTILGVGVLASYRFYYDYPCLWAACVMKEAERFSSQQKYDDASRVLTEAENSYFFGKAKLVIRRYAVYAEGLRHYPRLLEDRATSEEFLRNLDSALDALQTTSHYEGIRHSLLWKKLEAAIRQQDHERLKAVFNENPPDKIVILGLNLLLNLTFYLALRDPATACRHLRELGLLFPNRFHSTTNSLRTLLETHSESFQAWPHLSILSLMQNPPSQEIVDRWANAIKELQIFFKKNVGENGVYEDLQYYRMLISFAHERNNEPIETLFKKSDVRLHRQFSHALVLAAKHLLERKEKRLAANLLDKAHSLSFKDRELIHSYRRFVSLRYPLEALQRTSPPEEQIRALESCLACLQEDSHNDLQRTFCAYKIVVYLDSERYADAERLLAQETPDSKVHTEVTARLFEKVYASKPDKALEDLQKIKDNLKSCKHISLFNALQVYLSHTPQTSLDTRFADLTSLMEHLSPIEQLASFTSKFNIQCHLVYFELCLNTGEFEKAQQLLSPQLPDNLYSDLCKMLVIFLIESSAQQTQPPQLHTAREWMLRLNRLFSIPQSDIIQAYANFLTLLERAEESRELTLYKQAAQSLSIIFEKLLSNQYLIPESLKKRMARINIKIAVLAKQIGERATIIAAFESIQQLGLTDMAPEISRFEKLLN
jgi:hypothetical protein